jgi:PAS domain S-box-containing protein
MFDLKDYGLINQLVFDTANVGICVTNKHRKFVKINQAYCDLYGYQEHELLNQDFTMVLPSEQEAHASPLHERYIQNKTEETAGEWRVKHKNGQLIDVWVTTGRFVDSKGDTFKVTTVTDIRAQKKYIKQLQQALDIKDVLLKEVHHRVKNNLNMIGNLIYLQNDGGSEIVKSKLRDVANRIRSLSIIHEKLYHNENLAFISTNDFVPDFLSEIINTYNRNGQIDIKADIADITLTESTAINLGLIINELITNCIKHAFLADSTNNEIIVTVKESNGLIALTVADNGVGIANTPKSDSSLGLTLIRNLAGDEVILKDNKGLTVEVKIKKDHES